VRHFVHPRSVTFFESRTHMGACRAGARVRAGDRTLGHEIVKGGLDSVELGALKGNQGDQNYDLPSAADLNKYQAVAIYCERFYAIFGVAKLEQF